MDDKTKHSPTPFQKLLQRLIEESGESYRHASQASGLHHTSVSRYLSGTTPSRDACIALADHFGVNPNEMLEAAGYAPLHFFEKEEIDLSKVSPETRLIFEKLERMDPHLREELLKVITVMLDGYLQGAKTGELAEEESEELVEPKPTLEGVGNR